MRLLRRVAVVLLLIIPGTLVADYARSTDPSGCVIEQITDADYDEHHFNGVSRDGEWLVYGFTKPDDAEGNPVRGTKLLNLMTGADKELDPALNNGGSFSPDGRYLVGAHYTDDMRTEIIEYEITTGKKKTIASHEQWDWLASYSPDGEHIVFNSFREDGQSDVFLYDRENAALKRVTDSARYDAHAQFAPGGEKILYHHIRGRREAGGYVIDLMQADLVTGEVAALFVNGAEASYGSWGSDGQHFVMSSDFEEAPEKSNLYIVGPNAEILVQLTDGDWKDSYSWWMQDGSFIYFNSDRNGKTDIFRMPMNGFDCQRPG